MGSGNPHMRFPFVALRGTAASRPCGGADDVLPRVIAAAAATRAGCQVCGRVRRPLSETAEQGVVTGRFRRTRSIASSQHVAFMRKSANTARLRCKLAVRPRCVDPRATEPTLAAAQTWRSFDLSLIAPTVPRQLGGGGLPPSSVVDIFYFIPEPRKSCS